MSNTKTDKTNIPPYTKKHKILTELLVITICFFVILIIIQIFPIKSEPESEPISIKLPSDSSYDLNITQSEFELNCNTDDGKYCQMRTVQGSILNSCGRLDDCKYHVDEHGNIDYSEGRISLYEYYAVENFDLSLLPDAIERNFTIELGDYRPQAILSKDITVKFNLSVTDKERIEAAQKEWFKNKQDDEAKAKEENGE